MSLATDASVRSAVGLLSAWIESQLAYSGVPGLSIGVVHDGNPMAIVEKAYRWVAPAIRQAAPPPAPPGAPAGWERYAGRYRDAWHDLQVLVVDGRLALLDPSLPDPLPFVIWLHPVAGHTFRSETKNGFGTNAEPVVFDVDAAGRGRRLTIGENSLEPVVQW